MMPKEKGSLTARKMATTRRARASTMAVPVLTVPAAKGRNFFRAWALSECTSRMSLKIYVADAVRQKQMVARRALLAMARLLQVCDRSTGNSTRIFFTHWYGRRRKKRGAMVPWPSWEGGCGVVAVGAEVVLSITIMIRCKVLQLESVTQVKSWHFRMQVRVRSAGGCVL